MTALRRLGPGDEALLGAFLDQQPVEYCLAGGMWRRYGFDGPPAYYGSDDLAGLVTVDRGRALLLGDLEPVLRESGELLAGLALRFAMGPTGLVDLLLQAAAPALATWRHQPQQVEQQMVLYPSDLQIVPPPEELTIAAATPDDAPLLAEVLRDAPGWAGEGADALARRMARGLLLLAREGEQTGGSALLGAVWANCADPRCPRLSRLWVGEEYRHAGLATAMVSAICGRLAGSAGLLAVVSWVQQRDAEGKRVLSRAGFRSGSLWKKIHLTAVS